MPGMNERTFVLCEALARRIDRIRKTIVKETRVIYMMRSCINGLRVYSKYPYLHEPVP